MMKPLDYGRSFLIGTVPANEVRFWAESRTRILDEQNGRSEDYIQTGSCKSENTFPKEDLFVPDNYDFLPIFGPQYGVIFRCRAWLNPEYKQCLPVSDMWDGPKRHLVEAASFEELATNEQVIEATHAFLPIVSQIEVWDEGTGLRATIECPVKTMNTNREHNVYQVDTGPVAFPDLSERHGRHVDGIALAFVAFNAPHFADFVIEEPTVLRAHGQESAECCQVYHFSRRVSLTATNRLYAVTS
ncbi:MAG: hypothetical protein V1800_01035 [Candidatus Latescibacterota bacterium]